MRRAPLDPVFVSTFLYAAGKILGPRFAQWRDEVLADVANLDAAEWAGLRAIGQAARAFRSMQVYADGSTLIAKARCVAAGHFLRGRGRERDVWLSIDDDNYASADVLARLVRACRETRGLVALPCVHRDGSCMTFRRVHGEARELGAADLLVRDVDRVGMGLVAMHRDFVGALDAVAESFVDVDGFGSIVCPGIFREGPGQGIWQGEDFALCALAESHGLPLHMLLEAPCEHAGRVAMLDRDGRVLVRGDQAARDLDDGIGRRNAFARERSHDTVPDAMAPEQSAD